MSNTKSNVLALDGNGRVIPSIIPADYSKIKVFTLNIPAGSRRAIGSAADIPKSDAVTSIPAPVLTDMIVINETTQAIRVGGSEVTAALGMPMLPGNVIPQRLSLQTDPDVTYIYNPGVAAIDVQIAVFGNF